jgi:hypothetical protein
MIIGVASARPAALHGDARETRTRRANGDEKRADRVQL